MERFSLAGSSPAFLRTLGLIAKLARIDVPLLIEGETGTGKELAARAIHYQGARSEGPFVPVNCGAFPDTLVESELFGHVRGSFTDARNDRVGLVEAARGGTLFLDEVDALSPKAQVTLLRFLQDSHYRPVGGRVEHKADVRVIAASNAPLDGLAESGQFRMDLLFRLRVMSLRLPPLREREGDALLLARLFFSRCRSDHACAPRELDTASCDWFDRYHWPGNVRELEALIYRETLIADQAVLCLSEPAALARERRKRPDRRSQDFDGVELVEAKARMVQEFERSYLHRLMDKAEGNVTRAALLAGKERRALGKLLKKYGMGGGDPSKLS
ncbi:sigma-54 dependent transcriptional regulator [Niveibacterium sp. SC-1]|uniref:sigma-54 dependent transcriptional regulator n=1 Tax=Niveibacterium sp. SC-1 TaxID=3135646 RepID=UPI00311D6BEF